MKEYTLKKRYDGIFSETVVRCIVCDRRRLGFYAMHHVLQQVKSMFLLQKCSFCIALFSLAVYRLLSAQCAIRAAYVLLLLASTHVQMMRMGK